MEKLFSQMFMSFREAAHMSLMKEDHVEFHSYLTIWTSTEFAFESMLWRGFEIFYIAPYSRTMLTM